MAIPAEPTVEVIPSTEKDIDKMVDWLYNVMEKGDPVVEPIFVHPELAFKDIPTTREMFTDPPHETYKAVVVSGGEDGGDRMAGFVTAWLATADWVEEEAAVAAKKGDSPPWHRADPKMLSQFLGQMADSRREILSGKPHLFIQFLCVDTPYQHKGIGKKLMEYVLRIAREANVPAYLDSTHAGRRLYSQLGFEVMKTLKLETAAGRIIEFPSMMKRA